MIFVECKPDELLVRRISGLPRREVVHELKGKYEICERLAKQRDCIGILDEDPGSHVPAYLTRISQYNDILQHGLRIFEDGARNNRAILLRPKLEDWLLRAAADARLAMSSFGLPNSPSALHRVINVDLRKFERLLDDLLNADIVRMKMLAQLLSGHIEPRS